MKSTLGLTALVALAALSCSPGVEPAGDMPSADGAQPHFVKWSAVDGPIQLSAVGALDGVTRVRPKEGEAGLALSQIALDAYQASFWAVRGQERTLQLNYVSPSGTSPFLRLDVEEPVRRPDGSSIAWGDSVLISVVVDPENIRVFLEPTGLQFDDDDPTELRMWWTGANGDLNGDGVVNATDQEIEQQWLGMWYQASAGDPWGAISADKSLEYKRLRAYLRHFSGYAVSW